jgi:hypothetical protein
MGSEVGGFADNGTVVVGVKLWYLRRRLKQVDLAEAANVSSIGMTMSVIRLWFWKTR